MTQRRDDKIPVVAQIGAQPAFPARQPERTVTEDAVLQHETPLHKMVHGGMVDSLRRLVNVFRSSATEPVDNLFKRSVDTMDDVVQGSTRRWVNTGVADATGSVDLTGAGISGFDMDHVVQGTTFRKPKATAVDGTGNIDLGGTGWINKILDNVGDGVTYGKTVLSYLTSGKVAKVFRSAIDEPVANLFKRGTDTFDDVLDGATWKRIANVVSNRVTHSSLENASRRTDTLVADGAAHFYRILTITGGGNGRGAARILVSIPGQGGSSGSADFLATVDWSSREGIVLYSAVGFALLKTLRVVRDAVNNQSFVDIEFSAPSTPSPFNHQIQMVTSTGWSSFTHGFLQDPTVPVGARTVVLDMQQAPRHGSSVNDLSVNGENNYVARDGTHRVAGLPVITSTASLDTRVPDSRGALVNSMFRYAVDTLDGVLDSSTYGRLVVAYLSLGKLIKVLRSGTDELVDNLFKKSVDTADSVGRGSLFGIPKVGATDVNGNIDLAGAAWINKVLDNIGDGVTYGKTVAAYLSSGKVFKVFRASTDEPVDNLFKKSVDTADSVARGSLFGIPKVGATDSSGNLDLNGSAWINKILDNVSDGVTYARTVASYLTSGKVSSLLRGGVDESPANLFKKAVDTLDSVLDGATWKRIANVTSANRVGYLAMDDRSQRSDTDSWSANTWVRVLSWAGGSGRGGARIRIADGGGGLNPGAMEFVIGNDWSTAGQLRLVSSSGQLGLFSVRLIRDSAGGNGYFDVQFQTTGGVATTFITQVEMLQGTGYTSWTHGWTKAPTVPGGAVVINFDCSDAPNTGHSYTNSTAFYENVGKFSSDGRLKMNNAEVITQAGHVESRVNDSRGAAVNGMFRASVDTLDSVVDGGTYKRIAGVNGSNQITPTSSTSRNRCKVNDGPSGVQAIASSATTKTALLWHNELVDVGNLHESVTNPGRITVPTGGNTGMWIIHAHIEMVYFSGDTAVGAYRIAIRKNGTTELTVHRELHQTDTAFLEQNKMDVFVFDSDPTVGDYYEVTIAQNSGHSQNIDGTNSFFEALHNW